MGSIASDEKVFYKTKTLIQKNIVRRIGPHHERLVM